MADWHDITWRWEMRSNDDDEVEVVDAERASVVEWRRVASRSHSQPVLPTSFYASSGVHDSCCKSLLESFQASSVHGRRQTVSVYSNVYSNRWQTARDSCGSRNFVSVQLQQCERRRLTDNVCEFISGSMPLPVASRSSKSESICTRVASFPCRRSSNRRLTSVRVVRRQLITADAIPLATVTL